MLAYIGKRLLLMIPTLIGVLTLTFVVIQFVPGGPVEQLVAESAGRDHGRHQRVLGQARPRHEADRGAEEALRLRQAAARRATSR